MDTRLKYITGMGWLPNMRSDSDVYDSVASTRYLVRLREGSGGDSTPGVSAGLRLTRVPSFYESLTWSMLEKAPTAQKTLDAQFKSEAGRRVRRTLAGESELWDVTRLVAPMDGTVPASEIVNSIYELFGMAFYETVIRTQADPCWVFLTTASIKRLFDMSGIEYSVIFSGRVSSSDDYDSFLCVTRPKSAFSMMRRSPNLAHRRAFKRVATGRDAVRDLPLEMTGT